MTVLLPSPSSLRHQTRRLCSTQANPFDPGFVDDTDWAGKPSASYGEGGGRGNCPSWSHSPNAQVVPTNHINLFAGHYWTIDIHPQHFIVHCHWLIAVSIVIRTNPLWKLGLPALLGWCRWHSHVSAEDAAPHPPGHEVLRFNIIQVVNMEDNSEESKSKSWQWCAFDVQRGVPPATS